MDAKIFGAFIAECRKDKNMTQAELAIKLNITDKAVSRWERGIGFPDISTIEPLASALEISVLELMKSERIISNEIPKDEATGIIVDTLDIVKLQRKQERKNALFILEIITVIVIFVLFLDSMQWQMDTIIFTGVGVVFPLFCIFGFVVLLCNAIWRKITGKSCGQTFITALALLLLLILFMGVFFLIGALGIGPVPN
ncbi:MAG: helix-turn-helix domain-containing protein [Clostridium sp.]|nr:helix-turn-helix domain-containing protein [Acetatifactor muris]MCM1527084.1 helix-turn-helix domain-containing protein [Bacteroides sp.]MCM1562060.1 helix-turn-helix domain-containing protein [Clostridium sp.]